MPPERTHVHSLIASSPLAAATLETVGIGQDGIQILRLQLSTPELGHRASSGIGAVPAPASAPAPACEIERSLSLVSTSQSRLTSSSTSLSPTPSWTLTLPSTRVASGLLETFASQRERDLAGRELQARAQALRAQQEPSPAAEPSPVSHETLLLRSEAKSLAETSADLSRSRRRHFWSRPATQAAAVQPPAPATEQMVAPTSGSRPSISRHGSSSVIGEAGRPPPPALQRRQSSRQVFEQLTALDERVRSLSRPGSTLALELSRTRLHTTESSLASTPRTTPRGTTDERSGAEPACGAAASSPRRSDPASASRTQQPTAEERVQQAAKDRLRAEKLKQRLKQRAANQFKYSEREKHTAEDEWTED